METTLAAPSEEIPVPEAEPSRFARRRIQAYIGFGQLCLLYKFLAHPAAEEESSVGEEEEGDIDETRTKGCDRGGTAVYAQGERDWDFRRNLGRAAELSTAGRGRGEAPGAVSRGFCLDAVSDGASESLLVKETRSWVGLAREVVVRRMAPCQAAGELARADFVWASTQIGWNCGSSVG